VLLRADCWRLFRPHRFGAGASQRGGDPLGIRAVEIDGDLQGIFHFRVPFRRGRRLRVRSSGTRAYAVRVSDGLDEHIGARHAALLDDMLDGKLRASTRVECSYDRRFHRDVSRFIRLHVNS
jgi:hypothetical protein